MSAGHHDQAHVVVIGGGIAGLAAATSLTELSNPPRVTVIEADDRFGGKLLSTPFAGLDAVDEGPDAFLARIPFATSLARAVGLGEQLTSPTGGGAFVYWNGLHDIPAGLTLGLPTGFASLARSRLLSASGKARAALEPLLPRTPLDADSIGDYVRTRFGTEVHERLVDPLVGSIYAADTDHFSLTAVPQLAAVANASRSVVMSRRPKPPATSGPIFYAPQHGMTSLVDA
ncbi:MAG TPA: protoporphyrinogen oxidase, partial [Ilumatobacteraceae bacterium]|nr:protoporphyrinogen oxidase [Ilumatobacteraceae bacterium]